MAETPLIRILIVDDEEPQMKALCATLRDHGYETTGYAGGGPALAALTPGRFDLILSDLMMPGMDGITFLRAALQQDPSLIGIIMTGEGTIATAVEAMKSGAFDYVLKPFRLSVMLPVLARALDVRRLRIKNAELEQRVLDRTAELEAANKELEAFSYSVSHDLRAPLRHIDGFAHLVIAKHLALLPADGQRHLQQIAASAQRMSQLIDDLLRLSRLGRQALAKQPIALAALVAGVAEEIARDQGGRVVEFRLGALPDCHGDPALLRQVFINLLSNAFKFTRKRPNALVEADFRSEAGETVYFVRDNGAGFDPKYAENLFGVFQRLHSADQFEGTGVGLSIVQRIIRRHGGRIWAEAAVDRGATFFFTLPG